MSKKPIHIQSLNIECPRCGVGIMFPCKHKKYGEVTTPHPERVKALTNLIAESDKDWVVRKLLRERNFAR